VPEGADGVPTVGVIATALLDAAPAPQPFSGYTLIEKSAAPGVKFTVMELVPVPVAIVPPGIVQT
jgi:hypothetical protein